MSEAITASYPAFNAKVKANKKEVLKKIKSQMEQSKLELLKEALDSNNIIYDKNITDYHKFIDSLRKNLDSRNLSLANSLIENVNTSIDGMVSELEKGSESAFTKFISKIEGFFKPLAKGAASSLAASTILSLVPTPIGKIGASIVLTGISLFNMSKIDKCKLVTNKTYELNRILEELEITRDKDGNIVDTRYGEAIIVAIKDFFKTNYIQYIDTGYLSLREAIYKLDNETKEKLCHVINNIKGNQIKIEEQLKDVNTNFFARMNNKYVKPAIVGATSGIGTATAINSIDPGLISSIVNSGVVKFLVDKFSDSKVLSWISSAVSGGLSLFGKYIPVVGPAINKILAIENIGVLAVGGAGLGILSSIGKSVYDAIKKRKQNYATQKEQKKIQELDLKLYGANDIVEIKNMQEIAAANKEKPEKVVINAVCEYMDELEIAYPRRPKNYEELKEIINTLDKDNKAKVNELLSTLDDFLKRDPNDFRRGIKKTMKVVQTLSTLGLASMSIVNLLSAGGFFEAIKQKYFAKYGYKLPEKLPVFDDSVGQANYVEAQKASIQSAETLASSSADVVTSVSTETLTSSSTAAPAVTPAPTPAPTSTPTPSPQPSVAPSKESIPTIESVMEQVAARNVKDYIDIHELMVRGDKDGLKALSQLSPEELYRSFSKMNNPYHMEEAMKWIPTDAFDKLREYMETSGALSRHDTAYKFVREGMKSFITEKNNLIEQETARLLRRFATEDKLSKAGLIVNSALIGKNEIDKGRLK